MADTQQIARALQGFSAGVAGKGPQFLQQLDENRKSALVQDAFEVMQQLRQNNVQGARDNLLARNQAILDLGGDNSDTLELLQKLEAGDIQGALVDVSTVVEFAQAEGRLDITQPRQQIVDGQVVSVDPRTGGASAQPIAGFTQDPGRERDRSIRERQVTVAEATEQRQTTKLSAGLENALIKAQDATVVAQRNSNMFDTLANDFERLVAGGGVQTSVSETFKQILGTQDDVTELRRSFNKVRLSEGLKNLPPGPATDRDVKEAFKGVPPESAPPQQVASFLRGAARLARFEAGFNQFKSDFISGKSSAKGLNKAWRRQIDAPSLERKVSIAEIYETAQDESITPEDVMQQLGITVGLF